LKYVDEKKDILVKNMLDVEMKIEKNEKKIMIVKKELIELMRNVRINEVY
jgi:hypothetical protein